MPPKGFRARMKRLFRPKSSQGSFPTSQPPPPSRPVSPYPTVSNASIIPATINPSASPSSVDLTLHSQSPTPVQSSPNNASGSMNSAAALPPEFSPSSSQNMVQSNAYELLLRPSVVVTSSGTNPSSRTKQLKGYGKMGWTILKDVLKVVKEASVPLPPLQAAVGGLLATMELIDMTVSTDKQEQFIIIARKVEALKHIMEKYQAPGVEKPLAVETRLKGLAQAIELLKNSTENKTQVRNAFRRVVSASDDAQEIADAFQALASLLEVFSFEGIVEIERKTDSIRADLREMKFENNLAGLTIVHSASFRNQKSKDMCTPGTRVPLLQSLLTWALDPNSHRVYWLNGIAGTGKSTIARSLCSLLESNNLLGAAFFCSRQEGERSDALRIIPSLAYFLAREHIEYASELHSVLESDKDLAHVKVLKDQLQRLLANPSKSAFCAGLHMPVLVIDALDECSDGQDITMLLQLLLDNGPSSPFKLFITSRPVNQIEMSFSLNDLVHRSHSTFSLHDVEEFFIQADIKLYLTNELRRMQTDHRLPEDWATPGHITRLTTLSDKLFIYASTALKYIKDSPRLQLKRLVDKHVSAGVPLTKDLDSIYDLILRETLDPMKREEDEIMDTTRVLGAILTVREILSIDVLGELLGVGTERVEESLKFLHSLILIRNDRHVTTFHASLGDYLTDPNRSGNERWHIQQDFTNQDIACCCLRVAISELRFNLLNLKTSHYDNNDQALASNLPAHLLYTCRFWVDHVVAMSDTNVVALWNQITELLHNKFLFWLEVLSLARVFHEASSIIGLLSSALRRIGVGYDDLIPFLCDCDAFVIAFQEPITTSAPHIYLSALAWTSSTSLISQKYRELFPRTAWVFLSQSKDDPVAILNPEGRPSVVTSVGFSSDSSHIVSGSWDKTIRVWDAETGKQVLDPLQGHTDSVTSVAFSSDGGRIISVLRPGLS